MLFDWGSVFKLYPSIELYCHTWLFSHIFRYLLGGRGQDIEVIPDSDGSRDGIDYNRWSHLDILFDNL